MRLFPYIVVSLFVVVALATPGSPGAAESPAIPPIWVDRIDHGSLDDWQRVEGNGTVRIIEDPMRPEHVYLRVEGTSGDGPTRVVGPSVPTPLPVKVGFVFTTDAYPAEVRLVDVDGEIMTRATVFGNSITLENDTGARQTMWSAPGREHLDFTLTAEAVVARMWEGNAESHAADSQRPFDHIEVIVTERAVSIDHLTVVPTGSGFVDFFGRHTLEGSYTPWRATELEGGGLTLESPGVLTTTHAACVGAGSLAFFSFTDDQLALHEHGVDLYFRSVKASLTIGMPILFGVDGDGAPIWSVEMTNVRFAGSPDLENVGLRDLRTVVLRLPSGEEVEVLPPTGTPFQAWSELHVRTDPVSGVLRVWVDDAQPVEVQMPELADLAGLGVGDIYDDIRDAPLPVGWVCVDGVVAGYR